MPDYSKSKLYKLVCSSGYYYIGSTIEPYLCRRLANHRCDSQKPQYNKNKLYSHINSIGWDNVKIVLIEQFSCNSKDELKQKENELIVAAEMDSMCLNHNRAFLTEEERKERRKQWKTSDQARRNTIVVCECGVEHTVGRTQQHLNSVKHKSAMKD